ncbi:hypothetical protein EYF80_027365 [Liparis tanakae]|uniref:Uncharacterized protein n=1 Tax=Liparis tanakae TaxID=230148 RepID=A0A4Z2H989_9TELE|nr:hypothetical protein EYF80_027365 [Liparis tanakae]
MKSARRVKQEKPNAGAHKPDDVGPSSPVEEESIWVDFQGDQGGGAAVGLLDDDRNRDIRGENIHVHQPVCSASWTDTGLSCSAWTPGLAPAMARRDSLPGCQRLNPGYGELDSSEGTTIRTRPSFLPSFLLFHPGAAAAAAAASFPGRELNYKSEARGACSLPDLKKEAFSDNADGNGIPGTKLSLMIVPFLTVPPHGGGCTLNSYSFLHCHCLLHNPSCTTIQWQRGNTTVPSVQGRLHCGRTAGFSSDLLKDRKEVKIGRRAQARLKGGNEGPSPLFVTTFDPRSAHDCLTLFHLLQAVTVKFPMSPGLSAEFEPFPP